MELAKTDPSSDARAAAEARLEELEEKERQRHNKTSQRSTQKQKEAAQRAVASEADAAEREAALKAALKASQAEAEALRTQLQASQTEAVLCRMSPLCLRRAPKARCSWRPCSRMLLRRIFQCASILRHRREHDLAIVPELHRRKLQCVSRLLHRREHNLAIVPELTIGRKFQCVGIPSSSPLGAQPCDIA